MKRLFSISHYGVFWGHGKISCGILIGHRHYWKFVVFDYNHPLMDADEYWHRY